MISFIWGLQSSVDYLGNYPLTDQSIFHEEQKKLRGKWSWQKVQFDQRKMCHHSSLIHWDVLSLNDATQHQSDEVAIVTKNYNTKIPLRNSSPAHHCSQRTEAGWCFIVDLPFTSLQTIDYLNHKAEAAGHKRMASNGSRSSHCRKNLLHFVLLLFLWWFKLLQ